MRQAGILAAAGIVALETMVDRLADDHLRARKLADGLRQVKALELDAGTPATNMVFVTLSADIPMNARQVAAKLKEQGVLVGVVAERRFRLVTHYWIDDEGVNAAVQAFSTTIQ
jgi:threonine aldolase